MIQLWFFFFHILLLPLVWCLLGCQSVIWHRHPTCPSLSSCSIPISHISIKSFISSSSEITQFVLIKICPPTHTITAAGSSISTLHLMLGGVCVRVWVCGCLNMSVCVDCRYIYWWCFMLWRQFLLSVTLPSWIWRWCWCLPSWVL